MLYLSAINHKLTFKIKTKNAMKKLIFATIAIMALCVSCSKSNVDPADAQIPVILQNLAGKWYHKEFIKTDGTAKPFIKVKCPAQRDYVDFLFTGNVKSYIYNSICVAEDTAGSSSFSLNPGTNELYGSGYFEGNITVLTSKTLRIDYTSPTMTEMHGNTIIKAMVMTRD